MAVLHSTRLGLRHVCPVQGSVCTLTLQLEGVWGQGNKMLGWRGRMELGVVFAGGWAEHPWALLMARQSQLGPGTVVLCAGESRARA